MKIKKYFRCGKVSTGVEVNKSELVELKINNDVISISEADLNNLKDYDDLETVGVIFGDIQNIEGLSDSWYRMKTETVVNPDCWFVLNPEKHGYKEFNSSGFTFGDAVELLKQGYKVARHGWNGKNMFLFLVPGSKFKVSRPPLLGIYEEGTEIEYHPHIDMKTASGDIVPWLASHTDVLAEDWCIVEKIQ